MSSNGNSTFPNWVLALLLIIVLSLIGLAGSLVADTEISLWLLFGLSVMISVERWYMNTIRKHKWLGKLYRLAINLFLLSIIGMLIWTGFNLFSDQFVTGSLIGSVLFIAEIVVLILVWRVVNRFSKRFPSFKLTVFGLLCLFLVFAFTGVSPMSTYKDTVIAEWDRYQIEATSGLSHVPSGDVSPQVDTVLTGSFYLINEVSSYLGELWDKDIGHYAVMFNEYRQEEGLAPLTFTDDLNEIAKLRLAQIKISYSHHSKGGHNRYLAENILNNTDSNRHALNVWKNSMGHNENLLNTTYRNTGYAAGGGYAVQVFSDWNTINGVPQLPSGWYFPD